MVWWEGEGEGRENRIAPRLSMSSEEVYCVVVVVDEVVVMMEGWMGIRIIVYLFRWIIEWVYVFDILTELSWFVLWFWR